MNEQEKELLKEFAGSRKNGVSAFEIYDFGVKRPKSPDFWEELRKLGKVEITSLKYGVEFDF